MNETSNEPAGRRLGYAPVSTDEQDETLQLQKLDEHGCSLYFVDHGISGTTTRRSRLDAMLAEMRPGDTVVRYPLSRLGRNTRHIIDLDERFARERVYLASATEPIDTTTPTGRFTFTLLAALATMEREILAERTWDGIAAARSKGKKVGRPEALSAVGRRQARNLRCGGEKLPDIADVLKVSEPSVRRALQDVDAA
jgi:DNA invertase Pin-like site-specific DNA recombinase